MTLTFWWIFAIVFGIIIGNLWLIRRSKGMGTQSLPPKKQQKKSTDHRDYSTSEDDSDGGSGD